MMAGVLAAVLVAPAWQQSNGRGTQGVGQAHKAHPSWIGGHQRNGMRHSPIAEGTAEVRCQLALILPMKILERLGNLDARPEDGGISP